MVRIKFKKDMQRKFLEKNLQILGCPTIKELSNRLSINYHTLKSYFLERRKLPKSIFDDLINASSINNGDFNVEILDENYGQVLGGKKSKRS